jgi:general secretion pathway protein G
MRRTNLDAMMVVAMLVVVTIIALFATLVAPSMVGHLEKSKFVAARAQIANFEQPVTQYKLDTGVFPATEQGLEALLIGPANVAHWDGPYLVKETPLDPWGHPYLYKFPGEHGNQPDIISYGADGRAGGEGSSADVVSWKN